MSLSHPPPSARDALVLATLTADGTRTTGPCSARELDALAAWLDYVNHDGTTSAELRTDLMRFAQVGWLAIEGERFTLLEPGRVEVLRARSTKGSEP